MDWRDVLQKRGFEIHVIGTPLRLETTKKPIVNVLMPGQTAGELAVSEDQAALAVLEKGDWKASKEKWQKLADDKGFGYQTLDVVVEDEKATMWLFQKQRRDTPQLPHVLAPMFAAGSPQYGLTSRANLALLEMPAYINPEKLRQLETIDGGRRWAEAPFEVPGALERIVRTTSDELIAAPDRVWFLLFESRGFWRIIDGSNPASSRVFESPVGEWEQETLQGRYIVQFSVHNNRVIDLDTLRVVAEHPKIPLVKFITAQDNVFVYRDAGGMFDWDPLTNVRRDWGHVPTSGAWGNGAFVLTANEDGCRLWDRERRELAFQSRAIDIYGGPYTLLPSGILVGPSPGRGAYECDVRTGKITQRVPPREMDSARMFTETTTIGWRYEWGTVKDICIATRDKPTRWLPPATASKIVGGFYYFLYGEEWWRFKL